MLPIPSTNIRELDELLALVFACGMIYSVSDLTPETLDNVDEAATEAILGIVHCANPFLLTATA